MTANNTPAGIAVLNKVKLRGQPLISVRNCLFWPFVTKILRSKELFVSGFSPEATADIVHKSVKQLSLKCRSAPNSNLNLTRVLLVISPSRRMNVL
jgi:hypothetical protein